MYYHGDQIGSSRLMTSDGGWPVWQGNFLPYGEEYNQQITTNHYKFTGKERDSESGLDYFGARYYGSGLGRFMSTDPIHFQASMMGDPQRFNLYSYVRNNPIRFVDPKGEAIELTGTDEQRQKELNRLKNAVGSRASEYLYENKVETTNKDGSTTTRYFVGIKTGGPDGKGPAFASLNKVANSLSKIVGAQQIAQLAIVPVGTKIAGTIVAPTAIHYIPGVGEYNFGGSPAATQERIGRTSMLDPGIDPGELEKGKMSDYSRGLTDWGMIIMHELGHESYSWGLVPIRLQQRASAGP